MTIELDQPPNVVNILVFCHHIMKHIMAYMTLDQTTKTIAKFLWQGFILIFRAPAKLLSDQGANFESITIKELCESWAHGRLGLHLTMPRPNGKVEWAHQMLMQLKGKLSKDQEVDETKH